MRQTERPHENCYWVEAGSLLAGEYPGDKNEEKARRKIRRMLLHGITFFLDLTEPLENLRPYAELLREEAEAANLDVAYRSAPLPDYDVPPSRRHMVDILDIIHQAVAEDHCVYVHCWGGVGRTGIVIGCYLVRHGRSGQQALDELADHWRTVEKRTRHPESPQTLEQRQWVLGWSEAGPWTHPTRL